MCYPGGCCACCSSDVLGTKQRSVLTGKIQNIVFHEGFVYLFLFKEQSFLRNSGMEEKGKISSLVGTTPTAASSVFLHLDVPCFYKHTLATVLPLNYRIIFP